MTANKNKKRLDEILSSISKTDKYDVDAKLIMAHFINGILSVMESTDVSRKDLAGKIGTSASFITQVFKGTKSINFLTLAKIQEALNIKFTVGVKRKKGELKFDAKTIIEMSKSFQETNLWAYKIKSDYESSDFSPLSTKIEKEIIY
ncbi:MAG: helix-turn-helix transcriptional regulator [Bacteroidota bacterium]|nr:helix-turn-helix transcriptional regulator [Bacteroidota bacterium]